MGNSGTIRNKIITILVVAAFFLSNISQLPAFINAGFTQLVSVPIWILLFVSLIILNRLKVSRALFDIFVLTGSFIFIIMILTIIKGQTYLESSMVYSLIISLFMYFIGTLISPHWNEFLFKKVVIAYTISTIIVGLAVFFKYFGVGFTLETVEYAYGSKNSFSQITFTSIVLLYYSYRPNNNIQKILKITVLFFELFILFIIRSRASILSLVVVFAIMVLSKKADVKYRLIIFIIGLATIALIIFNKDFRDILLYNILFGNRDIRNLDSVSSGRLSILKEFPILIEGNWLAGLGSLYFECFPLSAILQFGILGGIIIIIISYMPLLISVVYVKAIKSQQWYILYLISIGYFINSLFEGLAPIGPGIKCYFLWILFGILYAKDYRLYDKGDQLSENQSYINKLTESNHMTII